jgi:transcriptional regulator with PAS, ATPase and Fis domain
MKERAIDVSGELLGLIDDYIKEGCKTGEDVSNKVVTMLAEKSILPQHVSIILEPFDSQKKELQEVQTEKDEQLVEGYSHLGKMQVKNLIKFIDQIISSINSYVALKQTTKAKRAKRPVPIAKIVSKLKYMRKFKDDAAKLDLVSIEPEKLHQSAEAWVYDTAKRKLYHFVADEMSKCLIIKGNTLLGFDTKESEAKILRKPEEQLKQIMGSKPAARKFFKDIKAVATTPNGRFNAAMIILKAF